jgi:phosphoribosylglycinamide formyltransferase-1
MSDRLALAVLISGTGRTLRNLLEQERAGRIPARVVLVISSRAEAPGLGFAEEARIETRVVRREDHASPAQFAEAVFDLCRERKVDLVVMGGFLKHLPIPGDFVGRVMNIHPALIPAFCGKGFYGQRVHQAVLDYGAKITGCTVHFVDELYDHGPVILQRAVPVRDDDTAESLAARVFQLECEAYPEAIRLFAEGRLRLEGRRVIVCER